MFQNRWMVLAIVSSALFLIGIDMTVLYTALPTLTQDLAATNAQKLWIVNAYPLVMAGLLPGLGSLGDRIGHRRIFVIGLVLFGIASLAAAYAPSADALIAARAFLAVGAATMMPATLSIIRLVFVNDTERAFAIGIWGSVFSGAAAVGPLIGGALLEHLWWGSVFLINVPVVVAALFLTLALVPKRPGDPDRHWDLVNSLQITLGLFGLIYALKDVARPGSDPVHAVMSLTLGVVFIVVFVRRQGRSKAPIIDFALFRSPRFSAGIVTAVVSAIALIGIQLAFSQHLQLVRGLSPLEAGLFMMPIAAAAFAAGPLAGLVLARIGTGRMLSLSLLVGGLGLAAFALLDRPTAFLHVTTLTAFGLGAGAAMAAASAAIMLSSPEEKAGMAASMEGLAYELGGTIGIALMGSILTFVYASSLVLPDAPNIPTLARESIDQALIAAESLAQEDAALLVERARSAFDGAFVTVLWTGVALHLLLASAIAFWPGARR